MTERISPKLKCIVAKRAQEEGEYCLTPAEYSSDPFVVEHISLGKGWTNRFGKFDFTRHGCNGHKHAKVTVIDSIGEEAQPLYNPRTQSWSEHFKWNEDQTQIIGQTPVGRATIAALHLNRPGVINLRRILTLMGNHPSTETNKNAE